MQLKWASFNLCFCPIWSPLLEEWSSQSQAWLTRLQTDIILLIVCNIINITSQKADGILPVTKQNKFLILMKQVYIGAAVNMSQIR
jgi:hypothetical protein